MRLNGHQISHQNLPKILSYGLLSCKFIIIKNKTLTYSYETVESMYPYINNEIMLNDTLTIHKIKFW